MVFKYVVVARDNLSRITEYHVLRNNNVPLWCSREVVTDNCTEALEAFEQLISCYGISHIKISPYNSKNPMVL